MTISADDGYGGLRDWDYHPAKLEWIELQELGFGSYSKVVLAKHAFEEGRISALKVVFLDDPELDVLTAQLLVQESALLQQLDHTNIVKCYNVISSSRAIVMELECLHGSSILDGIYFLKNTYSEKDASRIFVQIVKAVDYIHSLGVVHRDIKPENVVFAQKLPEEQTLVSLGTIPTVKLIDFGLAMRYEPHAPVFGCLGSAGFIAPEVIRGENHSPAMDIYGLGVLLFVMLVGRKPWDIRQCEKLQYHDIPVRDAPGLHDPRWLELSPDAKHLIMGMIAPDPSSRFTAKHILHHEWIETEGGRTFRHLGKSIALGAASVAEVRRLRFINKGLSAIVQETDVEFAKASGKDKYLLALERSRNKEKSVHGSKSFIGSVTKTFASKSFILAHDAGRSVHEGVLGGSCHLGNKSSSMRLLGRAMGHYIKERSLHGQSNFKPISKKHSASCSDLYQDPMLIDSDSEVYNNSNGRKVNIIPYLK